MKKANLISVTAGVKLKKLRIEAGYKISEFAALIQKSEQQLIRYESGITKIDLETLFLYLKALNANMCDFMQSLSLEFEEEDQKHLYIYKEKNKFNSQLADINY
ncbi:helix-turn-helix transcriptional regulator [Providencia rettgeri]|uniref:helix-turn-helix domain-containing protein n=1 Tax=Providencia rettgeri TaxID=587 RepID=UPI0022702DB1|nr:helix-turn-helix transcriptional regulator [Providencia rettgeri]MCX9110985.1 helix-turn-helix transcriptional regulator [Providencia rettgeri]